MRLKDKIFSKEIINSGRQPELDLAKAVLIFCLALIHCTIECTPGEQLAHGIPFLFDSVIGGPLSAPMFMFAMGIGMVYTKRHAPGDYVRRGIRIGITGYVLNICRFLFPFLAGYLLTGDMEKYIEPLPYRVLGNDMLQFAALAMIIIALFVRLHLSNMAMILVCLAMSVLGTLLNGVDAGSPAGNIILGYLIGTEDSAGAVISDFPLLNWLIVPVSGYVFGGLLRRVKNKNLFYGILSTAGLLVCMVYFPPAILGGWGMFGEGQNCYYHIVTTDVLVCIAAAFGILGIYHVVVPRLPKRVTDCIEEISRNINTVYCIHWVFVIWITNVLLYILRGTQELPTPVTLLLGTGISIVSIAAAHFWSTARRNKLPQAANKHQEAMEQEAKNEAS